MCAVQGKACSETLVARISVHVPQNVLVLVLGQVLASVQVLAPVLGPPPT
jgi:hypothetical protein